MFGKKPKQKSVNINPLMVVMSPRDFKITWYWLDKIDFLDKLIIKYYLHHIAHEIARDFFLKHREYTHFLIVTDDVIVTPSHVIQLIKDYLQYKYPIISCYCNWEWSNDWCNITDKDMRKTLVFSPYQYNFYRIKEMLGLVDQGKIEFPLKRVFFVGLPCTLIERWVVEKIGFRPYKYIFDSSLGVQARRGIMFDLQFCIDCANNNIPIYVDLRCLLVHMGNTRRYINLKGKKPRVDFVRRKRSLGSVLNLV